MAGIRVVAALGAGILVLMSVGAAAQQPLPEIVVTAPSPIASRPAGGSQGSLIVVEDAFAPVTVITEEDIRHATAHTLGDLLADKPGVAASTYAPGASRPIIRGLDNFRVRIQENGIGAHDVSDLGEDHGVPIDPLAAQKVEVVRGPATLRYGSQAIGGVVDVSNNRIPAFAPQRGISFVSKGALSSVDDGREAAMLLDAGSRNFAIHADAFSRRAWDYRIPDGSRQANSFVDSHGHSAGASFLFDNGFFGASVTRTLSRYGVPGVEAAESGTQIDLDQTKFNMKGELRPDSQAVTAIRFWFGASKYRHDELARENGEFGVISTFRNRQQEGRVEIEHGALASPLGMWNGAFGVQYANQRISTHGEAEEFLLPAHARTAAAYLFEQLKLTDTLKFQAAGRIERARASGTAGLFPADFIYAGVDPELAARERSFLPASLSAGVLQQLPFGVVASLTGQYVERAPTPAELFAKGVHEATGTFEIGNPDLQKEKARTLEFGLKRGKGDWRFDATAYYTKYAGFIFKSLTGNSCGDDFSTCIAGPGEELNQIAYAQRDATFRGFEVASQLDVMPLGNGIFGIDAQYDLVRATFADGTSVPRIPPQRLGGGVFWRNESWFARINLLHAFAQNDIAANETPTAGYNNLKAELSYTHRYRGGDFGPRELVVGVTGTNLLNEDMRNHVSFRKDEVLLPGRNIRGFATLRF